MYVTVFVCSCSALRFVQKSRIRILQRFYFLTVELLLDGIHIFYVSKILVTVCESIQALQ